MNLRSRFALSALTVVALVAFGPISYAQTAQLSGVITDSSGATLPKAKVTATDTATGETRLAESNLNGHYSLPALTPGNYSITVDADGFRSFVSKDVAIHVGQEVRFDFELQVGATREVVDVSSELPLLKTITSSSDTTITPLEIAQMPINGRNYLDLLQMVPGVSLNRQEEKTSDLAVPVLGERGGNTSFLIDGLSNADEANGGPAAQFNQETVAEFQVITTGYKAEFGHGSGGVVNVISRSGSNQWHGVGSLFHRNNAFDRTNTSDPHAPFLLRWDPSLTVGGPIFKDRVFLFTSVERIQEVRRLNFVFPPNTPQAVQNFEQSFDEPNTDRETRVFAKVDELVGRHRLAQEVNLTNSHVANFLPLSDATSLPSTRSNIDGRHLLLGFSDTLLLGSASDPMVLTLRGQYRREPSAKGPAHAAAGPTTRFFMFSGINTGDLAGDLGELFFGAGLGPGNLDQQYDGFGGNLVKNYGRHTFKFGADFIRTHVDGIESSRQFNLLFATLDDFAKFGPIDSGFFSLQTDGGATPELNEIHLRNNYTGLFLQDDWKIRNTLTLNLGVRWDYDSRFMTKDNVSPRLGFAWAVTPKTVVRGSWGYFYDHFRLGLARDVPGFGGASVAHTQAASFPRLFYGNPSILPDVLLGLCFSRTDTDAQVAAQSETCPYGALPFYGIDHLSNITAPGHSPIPGDGVVNVSNIESLSGLTPQQYADQASIAVGEQPGFFYWGPFGVLSFKAFGQGQLPVTLDSSFKTPVTRSLTFGVQRQVGSNWVVSADYYYKQIRNILGTRQTNLPFESRIPGNTFDGQPLNGYGSWYEGNYHAAIIAVNKRVSRRFSFGGSYTFTHATDNLGCGNLTAGVTGGCFPSDSFVGMTTVVTDPVSGKTNKTRRSPRATATRCQRRGFSTMARIWIADPRHWHYRTLWRRTG